MNGEYMSLETAKRIKQLETNYKNMQDSALQLDRIVKEKQQEIEKLNKCIKDDKENADEIIVEQQKEIERLNNIIKRLEEDLREMYLTFGEFSEEYTENRIRELKGSDKE